MFGGISLTSNHNRILFGVEYPNLPAILIVAMKFASIESWESTSISGNWEYNIIHVYRYDITMDYRWL